MALDPEHVQVSEPSNPDTTPIDILVVHEILPQPDRNGSDVRFLQILRELRRQNHRITYVARNGLLCERYGPALEELGITVYANDVERLRHLGIDSSPEWKFKELLRSNRFDLAILYLWFWSGTSVPEHYMQEIRRVSPSTRIAVLSEDQHGLREMRMAALTGAWSDFERGHDYEARETEICRRADMILVISEDDRRGFLQRIPGLTIEQVPMISSLAPQGPGFPQRTGILFLGNFENLANRDGVEWMLDRVWPRLLQQLPDVTLSLAGHGMPAGIERGRTGIDVLGHVADLEPVFAQHRVFVSPIRFGTGIKTKNLAALSRGLPLVTTTVGAEGMNLSNGRTALIADNEDEFASAIIRAYTDEDVWQRLSREGRGHIEMEFSEERLQRSLRAVICRARTLPAKAHDSSFQWSYLLVEQRCPEVLTHVPLRHRNLLRIIGYIQLAEEFLSLRRPSEALEQLRHIFSIVRGGVTANVLFFHALFVMARCYRDLGDSDRADRYAHAARFRTTAENPSLPAGTNRNKRSRAQTPRVQLSVILPTYQRRDTLRACLATLGAQSSLDERWEVIVVDDGSTDGTDEVCHKFSSFFPLQYVRQANAGAGAARRVAVERAAGEYLLLINDDTMADPGLLAEHLRVQREPRCEKIAVLGDFSYPSECRLRALTYFLSLSTILFPQVSLKPGIHDKNAYFIACNLSIRRDAVLAAGSFDPQFRVAEDTELGVRLRARGYRVFYHPKARAVHDHLSFTIDDFVRRARIYGRTQLQLFRKHPQLIGDGEGPFGRLDSASIEKIRECVARRRGEVAKAVEALQKFDSVDFTRFLAIRTTERTAADSVMEMFSCALPEILWHFLFDAFLEAWDEEPQKHPIPALAGARPKETHRVES